MITRQCVVCGTDYFIEPHRIHTAKCCSRACVYELRKRTPSPLDRRVARTCGICGKAFRVKRCQVGRYCSRVCSGVAKRMKQDPEIRRCVACKENKPLAEFRADSHEGRRRRYRCKACCALQMKRRSRTANGRWWNGRNAANRRGVLWDITIEHHAYLISQPCVYCGDPLNRTGHGMDRIDNGGGYSADNVVPCCGDCNRIRCHLLTYEEMLVLAPGLREIRARRQQAKEQ